MRAALEIFTKGINDLMRYLDVLMLQEGTVKYLLTMPEDATAKIYAESITNCKSMRKFEYSCSIITLYGLLERFVEDLLEAYINEICATVSEYDQLPEGFINAHYQLSLKHLSRAKEKRYRGTSSPKTIIDNLNGCLQNTHPFVITTETFMHHTSNFRKETIDEFFQKAGLQKACLKAVSTKTFIEFVINLNSPNIYSESNRGRIPQHIDVLAERRNEVAHGAISDILSYELLAEYVVIIKHFCLALFEVVVDELGFYKANYKGILIGKPINVISNNIVCLNNHGHEIKIGDHIVIETKCNLRPFRLAEVLSIQIDGKDISIIPAGCNSSIGLKINRRVKNSHDIYLLNE